MKIKVKVEGKFHEIELSNEQLWRAYQEQQHKLDLEVCDSYLEIRIESGDISFKDTKSRKEFIRDMADEFRRNLDKYDCDRDYAIEDAYSFVKLKMEEKAEKIPLKDYHVVIHVESSIDVDVKAESEDKARALAEETVQNMDDDEFNKEVSAGLEWEICDVWEEKVK